MKRVRSVMWIYGPDRTTVWTFPLRSRKHGTFEAGKVPCLYVEAEMICVPFALTGVPGNSSEDV